VEVYSYSTALRSTPTQIKIVTYYTRQLRPVPKGRSPDGALSVLAKQLKSKAVRTLESHATTVTVSSPSSGTNGVRVVHFSVALFGLWSIDP